MWVGFIWALAIGILAGLGVGSGGLYLVYLDLFTDTPQREAQGLNLVFFVFALLISVAVGLVKGGYRNERLLLSLLFVIPGALTGSYLAGLFPSASLKKGLGLLFIFSGIYTLFTLKKSKKSAKIQKRRRKIRGKT